MAAGGSRKVGVLALVLLVVLVLGGLVFVAMDVVANDPMMADAGEDATSTERSTTDDGEAGPDRPRSPRGGRREPRDTTRPPPRAGSAPPIQPGGAALSGDRPAVVLTIRGSDGKLLSGANVKVTDWQDDEDVVANGVTARGGQLRLEVDRPRSVRVDARYGRDRAVQYVSLDQGEPLPLELGLSEVVRIAGYVMHVDGTPVADAEVVSWKREMDENEIEFSDRSEDDGSFVLPDIPIARVNTWDGLLVRGDGIQPEWFTFEPERLRGSSLVLTLAGGVSVTGRCVDEEGEPVAQVWVRPDGSKRGEYTALDGSFKLRGMPESTTAIRLEPPGRVRRRIALGAIVSKAVDLGDVVLTNEGLISGVVFQVDGEPAEGADVMLLLPGTDQVLRQTQTDEDGNFTIIEVGESEYVLSVRGPRRLPLEDGLSCWRGYRQAPVLAGDEALQLHLAEPVLFVASVSLENPAEVVDSEGEKHPPMIVVTAHEQPAGYRYANQNYTGDAIRVWVPHTGPWTLEVSAAGHETVRLTDQLALTPEQPHADVQEGTDTLVPTPVKVSLKKKKDEDE